MIPSYTPNAINPASNTDPTTIRTTFTGESVVPTAGDVLATAGDVMTTAGGGSVAGCNVKTGFVSKMEGSSGGLELQIAGGGFAAKFEQA